MMSMGFVALAGYFINNDTIREFTDKDAMQWYMIIAGFAAFLGSLNLVQLHFQKITYKKDNWQYSFFTLIGFFIMKVDSLSCHIYLPCVYFYLRPNFLISPFLYHNDLDR